LVPTSQKSGLLSIFIRSNNLTPENQQFFQLKNTLKVIFLIIFKIQVCDRFISTVEFETNAFLESNFNYCHVTFLEISLSFKGKFWIAERVDVNLGIFKQTKFYFPKESRLNFKLFTKFHWRFS
jgi:hypothetical protein